jgi:hypothetical protein
MQKKGTDHTLFSAYNYLNAYELMKSSDSH